MVFDQRSKHVIPQTKIQSEFRRSPKVIHEISADLPPAHPVGLLLLVTGRKTWVAEFKRCQSVSRLLTGVIQIGRELLMEVHYPGGIQRLKESVLAHLEVAADLENVVAPNVGKSIQNLIIVLGQELR